MLKLCDLHTHSVFSDGTFTPMEIIDEAIRIGLSAVALCDHNTVDGLPEFLSAAEGKRIDAIAGSEFSVDYCGTEIHVLGLFIPQKYFSQVADAMTEVNRSKEQSNLELIDSLSRVGIHLDYDEIKRTTPNGLVNRAHIATAMAEKGYVTSKNEAFRTYLSPEWGHYKEPMRLTVWEILDFLREIKAVPVFAHPFLDLDEPQLRTLLPMAKEKGLVGMECFYSTYSEETTETSLRLASEFGLKFSGGSDFHGAKKEDIALGFGHGNLRIPYEWCIELKNAQGV